MRIARVLDGFLNRKKGPKGPGRDCATADAAGHHDRGDVPHQRSRGPLHARDHGPRDPFDESFEHGSMF